MVKLNKSEINLILNLLTKDNDLLDDDLGLDDAEKKLYRKIISQNNRLIKKLTKAVKSE